MNSSAEVRDRYLSLALGSRHIIDELVHFVESDALPTPELEQSLAQIIESLRNVSGGGNLFSPLHNRSPFAHYEQLVTLEEVKQTLHEQDIADRLLAIVAAGEQKEEKKETARDAIRFFCALEDRALQQFTQSTAVHNV